KFLLTIKNILLSDAEIPTTRQSKDYLYGLRGLLAIESFCWLFLQAFVPTVVSSRTSGPMYQIVARNMFSVPLWNESLIYSFFIILSARSVCMHFLQEPTAKSFARSLIVRPLRIGIPLAFALASSISLFSFIDKSYIETAAKILDNPNLTAPRMPATALASFNTAWDLLWITSDFAKQMANQAFPGASIWVPSLIYSQSYTVYIAMVILPFTRVSWHLQAVAIFSIGSFWFNSWGWYSAAGLLVADISHYPSLRACLDRGIKFNDDTSFSYRTLAVISVLVGLVMKYVWVAAFPQHLRAELLVHPSQHLSSVSSAHPDQPFARLDDYLVVVGVLVLLETSNRMQNIFSSRILVGLGKRSLSLYIAQSLMLYTVALDVLVLLGERHMSVVWAETVAFVVYLCSTAVSGEVFYRLVEQPATWVAEFLFNWSRK
ncbi:unnamed protein product, partial [Aureobasidium mustum]